MLDKICQMYCIQHICGSCDYWAFDLFVIKRYNGHNQLQDQNVKCTYHVLCIHTFLAIPPAHWKNITFCPASSVDSHYADIVGHKLFQRCQSEVRNAAASCIHWVSTCRCWFILNLIVDGSIRVEWGKPVQFNSTGCSTSNYGQHARWGGGCIREKKQLGVILTG